MAGETPFAGLNLPSFDDGPAEPLLEALSHTPQGSLDFRHGGAAARRSLDEAFLTHGSSGGGSAAAPSSSTMLRSHTVANPFDVGEMLSHINSCKLTGQQQLVRAGSGGPTVLTDGANRNFKWIQPSGARQPGQGCEDIEQGIVHAEQTPTGGALVRITLLAAGFIIGPSGASVRDICRLCESDVKSWTCGPDEVCCRPTRQFRVEGAPLAVARSLEVICDAVQRYKDLCEGKYAGQAVQRVQHIDGIDFSYQPPPRNIVPFAASLKSQSSAKRQGSGSSHHGHGHSHGRPPVGPSYKDAVSRTSSATLGPSMPTPVPHHPPAVGMARSSSLPPLSRSRASPSPTPSETPAPDTAASKAQGPPAAPAAVAASAAAGAKRAEQEQEAKPESEEEQPLPSPFSNASTSEEPSPSSPLEGGAGLVPKDRRKSGELPSQPPAPAKTLDKTAVLRSVFSSPRPASQPAAVVPELSEAATAALPGWMQQLALQQRQQQLAATAAAAQAVFPAQSSLLAELPRLMQPTHGLPAMLDPTGAAYGGVSPPQGQLQATLTALGLGGPGSEPVQQGVWGPVGSGAGGGSGNDWAANLGALNGLQASTAPPSPFDTNSAQGLLQLAASGLLPHHLNGPATPNPSPLAPTPFSSPEAPHQHQQLLAALQALPNMPPQNFGTVGSPERAFLGSPGDGSGSLSHAGVGLLASTLTGAGSGGPSNHSTGAEGLGLGSAFGRPFGGLPPAGQPSPHVSAVGEPFSMFSSPGVLGRDPAAVPPGRNSSFLARCSLSPAPTSTFSLSRASSLAFAEGPTQQGMGGSASRSFSVPLQQCASQQDPWAELLAAAVDGEGPAMANSSPGAQGQ